MITKDAVMGILTMEAKEYLDTFYGDLQSYVIARIEATVNTEGNVMEVLKK